MYNYTEIKQQNKQDEFAAMYRNVASSVLRLCGARIGESIVREGVRRAGHESGLQARERLKAAGVPTSLQNLFRCGRDYVEDPRVRGKQVIDEEQRQIWEVYSCPFAAYLANHGEKELGAFYCEEYLYAKVLAYTENVGQLCLSNRLTCRRDNYCLFASFFREANMTDERAAESVAARAPGGPPDRPLPPDVSFDDGIENMTVTVYYHLLAAAKERSGREGVCAVCEGLKAWEREAAAALRVQAEHTLLPVDAEFLAKNFPVRADSPAWAGHDGYGAKEYMEKLVLAPLGAVEKED